MINVILINGAPGSGKSTLAKKLADKFNIHQLIGTDSIREVLRTAYTNEQMPVLHTSAILACEWAPENESKDIWGFQQQAREVQPGVAAFINRAVKENKDIILEGIHLIPGIINNSDEYNLVQVVIKLDDEKRHIEQLGLQGDSRSSYKLDNFVKARKFQEYIINAGNQLNAIVVENDSLDSIVDEISKRMK